MFGNAGKVTHIGKQHRHFALFPAEFQSPRISRNPPDQLGRKIAVKGRVDISAAPLFAIEHQHGLRRIDHGQHQHEVSRIKQEAALGER